MKPAKLPKISVVMPVYNGENYIREAIDSILSQTFNDFELLITDDGSTDRSSSIARSFGDPRIKHCPNLTNKGIVASLNKGIAVAEGDYIAVMHADDVSLPGRFEAQAHFLDSHPEVSMVAVKTALIDSAGNDVGFWLEDQSVTSFDQIRATLPKTNCISHPSVMIRSSVAKTYLYNKRQIATEDYDLWLRLVADNHRIEKIDNVLLKYRVHPDSITSKTNTDLYKETRARALFLAESIVNRKAMNSFRLEVLKYFTRDFFKINRSLLKMKIQAIARRFFISAGKAFGAFFPKLRASKHGVLFFFPFSFTHIGGSERVHSDIVSSNLFREPWVILANEWIPERLQFEGDVICKTSVISPYLRNPISKHFLTGFFAGHINSTQPTIFGGNCEFFYSLLPHLLPQVFCVDIIHAYDSIMNEISLQHVTRLDRRIVIATELREALVALYDSHAISKSLASRVYHVDYCVDVPNVIPGRDSRTPLKLLFVGRGCVEKRVHLIGQIARRLAEKGVATNVSLVGDVIGYVDETDCSFCTFHGEIHDRNILNSLYRMADLLLITSSSEGLSLVKMEGMSFGVVPIAVAVGGIPEHIIHGETGFLVPPDQTEETIIHNFCEIIESISNNRDMLREISYRAHEYALTHFNRSRALSRFKELLEKP